MCTRYSAEPSEPNLRPHAFPFFWAVLAAIAAALLAGSSAWAQSGVTGLSTLPTAEQVVNRNQDPYAGSIPQGKATSEILDLTIDDALDRGLKYNLGLYLAARLTEQSSAAHLRALSNLLPVVNGSFSEEDQKLNLKQFGFTFPGNRTSVGPFGISDLRATGAWTVLDFHDINNIQAATQNVKAAQFTYRDARDTVVLAVGANYLLTIAQESRVAAAEAEFKLAQALYQLAADQEIAGLAPQIDTLRARVQLQAQQQALIRAQNDLEKQRISLARVIGLPVQQKFRLVNRVPYHPLPQMELETAYERALQTRYDYQAALASLRSAQLSREAAWKQRLPSIGMAGEYGVLGFTPDAMAPNWAAAATLRIPIFLGGKVEADVGQAEAVLKQRRAEVDDLRGRIEQDVQDALLDLKAAAQQVEVARLGLDLAQQTLGQSQDRFAAGVTNNVEVIQAQQQLALATELYIASLYAHNIGKVLLARAIGNAEQVVKQYLGQPGSTEPPDGVAPPSGTVNPAPGPAGTSGNVVPPTPQQNATPVPHE